MAWLNAVPKPDERSRRAKLKDAPALSRIEALKRDGVTPPMPPNPAPHFVGWLMELGLMEAAGMGAVPISWREIEAWQAGVSLRLKPLELRLLRRLSGEYLSESRRAESENAPPPWKAPVTAVERNTEADRIKAMFGGIDSLTG